MIAFCLLLIDGCLKFRRRSLAGLRQGQRPSCQEMPQARSQRILEGCCTHGDRICGDGIRGVFRQAYLHPDQQHHRRIRIEQELFEVEIMEE